MQQHSFPYQSPYRSSFPPKPVGSPVTNSVTFQDTHLSPTSSAAPPLPKSPPPSLIKSTSNAIPSSPDKVTPPQISPRPKGDKKTVSFNETVATNEAPPTPPEHEEPVEKVREDPNVRIHHLLL